LAVNYSRRIYPKEELRGGGRYPPRPCTYQSNSSTCIPYGIANIHAEALHTEADKLINHLRQVEVLLEDVSFVQWPGGDASFLLFWRFKVEVVHSVASVIGE
jgi:hypothetical protein